MNIELFGIFFSAFLVNNIVLTRFLALFSFFGSPTDIKTSAQMGILSIIVVFFSSALSWAINKFILFPMGLDFMATAFFVLIVVLLIQINVFYLKKILPDIYKTLEAHFHLITTNCVILAVAILATDYNFNLLQTITYSLGVSGGYFFVIIIFVHIREKLVMAPIPKWFQGYPIAFITAALMSLAFMGFIGMF